MSYSNLNIMQHRLATIWPPLVQQLKLFAGVLSGALFCGSLAAEPVHYQINFTLTQGAIMPTGSFDFDAEVPAFSNFVVNWNGLSFDLTASANAPSFRNYSPQDCTRDLGPNPETGFTLMILTGCVVEHYTFGAQWVGIVHPPQVINQAGDQEPSRAHFEFAAVNAAALQAVGIFTNLYDVDYGPRPFSSAGVWTVAPAVQLPEPNVAAMVLLGLTMLVFHRRPNGTARRSYLRSAH